MKILIDDILKSKNKTRNWLSNETGITYANISNLCNGKTESIKFEKIDLICSVLQCDISDIFQPDFINTNRSIVLQNKINSLP